MKNVYLIAMLLVAILTSTSSGATPNPSYCCKKRGGPTSPGETPPPAPTVAETENSEMDSHPEDKPLTSLELAERRRLNINEIDKLLRNIEQKLKGQGIEIDYKPIGRFEKGPQ